MNNEQKNIVFYVVLIAAIYVAYKVLKSLWFSVGAPEGATTGGSSQNLPVDTNRLSFPRNNYKAFADEIEQAIWGGFDLTEDDEAVAQVLSMMNTNDDVQELINAYGTRGEGILIQKYYNLVQTVQMYLDDDLKEAVNNIYQTKGIQYRWS